MSTILAIDPGNEQSAWVLLEDGKPASFAKESNDSLVHALRHRIGGFALYNTVAIEMVASFGMAVGREVFDTTRWVGRFEEAALRRCSDVRLVYRQDVKLFHCYSARANDANIRAAIIDRFGGKEKAIGRKASPGPLYGIAADVWSALAIALTVDGRPEPQAVPSAPMAIEEVPFG